MAASTSARRNSAANGSPNRKRTCVAPAVPSVVVSSRWVALRTVWLAAAMTVKSAQSQLPSSISVALLGSEHVIHVHVGGRLPAVGNKVVDNAGFVGDAQTVAFEGGGELVRGHEFVPLVRAAR